MNIEKIAKLIKSRWVHQIRCGETHRFVGITIVEAGGRFFVRQYKFGRESWYHAFLDNPDGAIKVKNVIIPIRGVVPKDLEEINPRVNRAYFRKMNVLYCLMRLTYDRKKHEASTLELIPRDLTVD